MKKPLLVVITGPTATGKTKLAVQIAFRHGGEIISADSRQVFKGMNIGTGKDLEEYNIGTTKIPYHLIDIAEPGSEFSVFDFQNDFVNAFEEIKERGTLPILCGGTGMYIDAVLKGYRMLKVPPNTRLRNELKEVDQDELISRLSQMKHLHNTTDTKDRSRLIRAIEIAEYEEKHRHEVKNFPAFDSLVFGVKYDRKILRSRITERLLIRLDKGLVKEVQSLIQSGVEADRLKFYGLEYRFITQYILGEMDYEEMVKKLNTAIHQFAKRQETWFRRMERKGTEINWLRGEWPMEEKIDYISRKIEEVER